MTDSGQFLLGGGGWWGKGGVGDITIMGITVWLHACCHGVNER